VKNHYLSALKMFKKHTVAVATSTPLKSSSARAFQKRLQQQFAALHDDQVLQQLIPARSTLHLDKLTQPKAHLYSINRQQPLFCDSSCGKSAYSTNQVQQSAEDAIAIFPTIFALWQLPHLLPRLIVHSPVATKLIGGADLFAPGVIRIESTTLVQRGSLVSICVAQNDAPFAVGQLLVDPNILKSQQAREGKAVKIMHCYCDELWQYSDKSVPNTGFIAQSVDACPDWSPVQLSIQHNASNDQQTSASTESTAPTHQSQSSAASATVQSPAPQTTVFDGLESKLDALAIDDAAAAAPESWDDAESAEQDATDTPQQEQSATDQVSANLDVESKAVAPTSKQAIVDSATMNAALEFALVLNRQLYRRPIRTCIN
jgi:predicted ribosome-associated RNA-binding protein Tma20